MSHPSINRWGTNLFWYNTWYTDKKKPLIASQDTMFNNLLYSYINFGVFSEKNVFMHDYWYFSKNLTITKDYKTHNSKYFQLIQHKNKLNDEISYYKIRIGMKHIYHSKLWIFRYQDWVIMQLYSYRPRIKKNVTKKRKVDRNFGLPLALKKKKHLLLLTRYKLFLNYFNKFWLNASNYYLF